MKRLIINTANDELSIVLENYGKLFYKLNNSRMHHNETMLLLIDEILKENNLEINQINELGVVIGPGSFTGIRVGISTIKAFRDSLNVKAKGINNLDFLFKLANSQFGVETVAIRGSLDSYFVAKLINGVVYKYEHNLTLEELNKVANGKKIGMFSADENVEHVLVKFDAEVLVKCFEESLDETLVPVYYQLSQAEREKLKKGQIEIRTATENDVNNIVDLEQNSFTFNQIQSEDFKNALNNKNYKIYIVTFDEKVAGFIMLQLTDEVCVESVAIDRPFRNLGLATKLFEHTFNEMKNNFQMMSLEVSEKNITAYLLYKKLGFEIRRIRKNYYKDGSNCFEMVKKL